MGIQLDQICISYASQRIIDSLTLHIAPGSFFTLLGPSGCGKTTLLRTIAGFVPVESGRLAFGGEDVTHVPAHRRNIGMVFQDYALFPNRSVFDNVAYGLRARGVAEGQLKSDVGAALERVGLSGLGQRLPAELSGGQRQRVALARALVIKPRVLLMDEPLSNQDAKLRVQVRETIAELQRELAITTVFVTHDQEEALALSDRIAVMHKGRIEQLGSPSEIYDSPATGYVADFIGAANLLPVQCLGGTGEQALVQLPGVTLQVRMPRPLAAGAATLVARPEHVRLEAPLASGLQGRLRSRQYLGVKTTWRIELPGGSIVSVDRPSGEAHQFAPGDTVGLGIDADKALVLAP